MKRLIKIAIVASFTAAAGFATFNNNTPATAGSSEAVSPRSLFLQNCARCHGSNGKAQTKLGKRLGADDIAGTNAAKVIRVATNGRKKMPSFKRKLSQAQIASIAGYVQSL